VRTRPALLLVCALSLAPSAALYAADPPKPVRTQPTASQKKDVILLDFGQWLRDRAKALANPFGALGMTTSPAPSKPLPMGPCLGVDRSHCPIG